MTDQVQMEDLRNHPLLKALEAAEQEYLSTHDVPEGTTFEVVLENESGFRLTVECVA